MFSSQETGQETKSTQKIETIIATQNNEEAKTISWPDSNSLEEIENYAKTNNLSKKDIESYINSIAIEKIKKMKAPYDLPLAYWAVLNGHMKLARILKNDRDFSNDAIERNDVNKFAHIFHAAIQAKNLELVKYLCQFKIITNDPNDQGVTPFGLAVLSQHQEIIKRLSEKFNIPLNETFYQKEHTKHTQGVYDKIEEHEADSTNYLSMLIEQASKQANQDDLIRIDELFQADPSSFNVNSGLTYHEECTTQGYGYDAPDASAAYGKKKIITPLALAIQKGRLDIVKYLIFKGADVNAGIILDKFEAYGSITIKEETTPLALALSLPKDEKNDEILATLLKAGADPDKGYTRSYKNSDHKEFVNKSPLYIALKNYSEKNFGTERIKLLARNAAQIKFEIKDAERREVEGCIDRFGTGISLLLDRRTDKFYALFTKDSYAKCFKEARRIDSRVFDALAYLTLRSKIADLYHKEFHPKGEEWVEKVEKGPLSPSFLAEIGFESEEQYEERSLSQVFADDLKVLPDLSQVFADDSPLMPEKSITDIKECQLQQILPSLDLDNINNLLNTKDIEPPIYPPLQLSEIPETPIQEIQENPMIASETANVASPAPFYSPPYIPMSFPELTVTPFYSMIPTVTVPVLTSYSSSIESTVPLSYPVPSSVELPAVTLDISPKNSTSLYPKLKNSSQSLTETPVDASVDTPKNSQTTSLFPTLSRLVKSSTSNFRIMSRSLTQTKNVDVPSQTTTLTSKKDAKKPAVENYSVNTTPLPPKAGEKQETASFMEDKKQHEESNNSVLSNVKSIFFPLVPTHELVTLEPKREENKKESHKKTRGNNNQKIALSN